MELEETEDRPARPQDREAARDAGTCSGSRRCDAWTRAATPSGLCVIERAPWGVIGMVLPATHSVPTMASNAINVIAAGNTADLQSAPRGGQVRRLRACRLFNREIEREVGVRNVITMAAEPSIESAEEIFQHPGRRAAVRDRRSRRWSRPRRSPASA